MIFNIDDSIKQALICGFSRAGALNMEALDFLPEVRQMCAADLCQSFGKRWTCPPACGSLESISKKAGAYHYGILVQTVGQMEGDFDYETMEETGKLHNQNFQCLLKKLQKSYPQLLPMGAGTCTICAECTYPDEPCRFPEYAYPSMEAYGLFVSDVCEKSGMPYYSGRQTITYTSCFLLK